MQRAYDNVIHDVALQNLNMVICLDRAGLVGADGATHHGVFDLACFRAVPNLTVASPLNEIELRNLMFTASQPNMGPFIIRYPRGRGYVADWHLPMHVLPVGKGCCIHDAGADAKVAVLSLGPRGNVALKALELMDAVSQDGIGVYNMVFAKPLDSDLVLAVAKRYKRIVTIEEGALAGGFGSAVLECLADAGLSIPVHRIGIPDHFIEHGSQDELYAILGMDADGLRKTFADELLKS